MRILEAQSSAAAEFLALRSATAAALLSQANGANSARRDLDAAWLESLAAKVAPADPAVCKALAARPRRTDAGPGPSAPRAGFIDLMRDPSIWRWSHNGAGSGTVQGELVLSGDDPDLMTEVTPDGVSLARRFTLRFRMRLDVLPREDEASIFVVFAGTGAQDDQENALILHPRGRHDLSFARQEDNPRRWILSDIQALPKGMPAPGVWYQWEIAWDQGSRRLAARIDGKTVFDHPLRDKDRLDGVLAFGIGHVERLRIREVQLRNEKP